MKKMRQDAWSKEEDIFLAETVIRHIQEGKTQLEAFKQAAESLFRTSAACGYRWNATVRKEYELAIEDAKNKRKTLVERQMKSAGPNKEDTIDSVITLLERFKDDRFVQVADDEKESIEKLTEENKKLLQQLKRYEDAWREMGKLWEWIHDKDIPTKEQ